MSEQIKPEAVELEIKITLQDAALLLQMLNEAPYKLAKRPAGILESAIKERMEKKTCE